jgi:hypothetical protein
MGVACSYLESLYLCVKNELINENVPLFYSFFSSILLSSLILFDVLFSGFYTLFLAELLLFPVNNDTNSSITVVFGVSYFLIYYLSSIKLSFLFAD